MRAITICLLAQTLFFAAALLPTVARASNALASPATDFSCGGNVHAEAIALWEQSLRPYTSEQIIRGLNRQGDVYVLYNSQIQLQSFVEMTRRCKDRKQIAELVDALSPAFDSLEPLPSAPATRGWVCKGGTTCTPVNHLLGKEVQLCSSQFLGLLGAVATTITEIIPQGQRSNAERAFLGDAATAMATQLDNWLSPAYFKQVAARKAMTPADAKDGQSKYFFLDRDLWFMTSLADLAELHQAGIMPDGAGAEAFKSLQTKHEQIAAIFDLFLARTTLSDAANGQRAEIDRGYWRNYADSKYAAYHADLSPVLCQKNAMGLMQKTFRVESKESYIDPDLGWDLSHARRLVPALDTLIRNQSNLAIVFGYRNTGFDPVRLQRAFANQIVDKIWNKDRQYPLFSNFWDGHNGWYRAGYENGTGSCRPGQRPYSLAFAFPTGSYPQWGSFNSTILSLSKRLYLLLHSTDPAAKAFMGKYYRALHVPISPSAASGRKPDTVTLAFLASLVAS